MPVAVSERALLFAPEIDAVGVPPATFKNPNLALVVAVEPSSRSSVVFLCVMALLVSWNGEPPLTTGKMPVISVPPVRLTRLEVRVPFAEL